MKLIGLSGTNGSGKDTVGHMLAERHNYLFVSMTDMLREEAKRRNLPVEREVLRTISAEWRRQSGLGVLVDKSVEYFNSLNQDYAGLVIASLRNPGEADRVHELGGEVIWVDADPKVRYDRIQSNAAARGRSEEDTKTFEQFLSEEAAEMQSSGDAATLNMSAVKELADKFLDNGGTDIGLFKDTTEKALGLV
jgi:cytidylate kinase